LEMVASGLPSELLLEELDCALTPRGARSKEDARHTWRKAGWREENGFAERDTIWIRRSREVYGREGMRGNLAVARINSGERSFANLHAANKAILHKIDVLHHLIEEDFAGEIANDLMDMNGGAAVWFGGEIRGFDVWVEDGPLACPVVPHSVVAVDATALHRIGPVHIGVHEVQDGVDVAGVEVLVSGGEEVAVSLHEASTFCMDFSIG
jgi:hypothetical protein